MIEMITIARAIVREGPYEIAEPILLESREVRGLTKSAMRAFEDALSKGCARALAKLGGFRSLPRRVGEGAKVARLWEVRSPALTFSPFTFELCRFLVSVPLGTPGGPKFSHAPKTIGDELVAYLACWLVEQKPLESILAAQPGIRACALAWLGFPRMLASAKSDEKLSADRFDALVRDGVTLEGLEVDLASRAKRFTREIAAEMLPARMLALGQSRERVLGGFVAACSAANRVDLASFIVESLDADMPKITLDRTAPLRDRIAARRASVAQLRVAMRLAGEHEKARGVSYIDEGYEVAQLLLARWEHVGVSGFARVASALSHIESWDGG